MITVRRSDERGQFDHGWLDTRHTFSFGQYHDPEHMGFRSLRVINEDRVAAGKGFGLHPHQDMEIVTYILAGALEHRDSMGNGAVLRAGDFQCMSAGTGVEHSEINPSDDAPVHFYQIWILPREAGLTPTYQDRPLVEAPTIDGLQVVVSPDGRENSLTINQDAVIHFGTFGRGGGVDLPLGTGRHGWVQVLRGGIDLDGMPLESGDGAALSDETAIRFRAGHGGADVLLFDLA